MRQRPTLAFAILALFSVSAMIALNGTESAETTLTASTAETPNLAAINETRAERKADEARRAAEAKRQADEAARAPAKVRTSRAGSTPRTRPAPRGNFDVSGNREIGLRMMLAAGYGQDQWPCLDELWGPLEGGWNQYADNPRSSAYGIPQALPGSKMASAGADWQTNPATQIRWGLSYIASRYGTPCKARAVRLAKGWY